jgi:predicted dehydrogenase
MARRTRRAFLKASALAGASFVIAGTKSSGKVIGANDTIRIGVAGINGRGGSHVDAWSKMKNVQITYLIDPDTKTYARHIKTITSRGGSEPKCVQDVREALQDKNLDAISIATPNHWHALMTIWGCQAGKDVYVEKPCSHNVHEGRIAVEMARKHKCIVQHGTQSRSSNSQAEAMAAIHSGQLGKLLVARGLCYKPRGSIGERGSYEVPDTVDYNIWAGPASNSTVTRPRFHYDWHWQWEYGNGDIGNQGVHEMDKARWGIKGGTLPKSVISLGGRFGYEDAGETPNTQIAVFDYGETQLIFEVRGLKTGRYLGEGVGNTYHLEAGVIAGNKFYPKGKTDPAPLPKVEVEQRLGGDHFGNFIYAMRSRKVEDLNADILEGHYSAALCHLANISYRLGQETAFNTKTKALGANTDAYDALSRMEEHLGSNDLKLLSATYQLGRKLAFDAKTEKFINDSEADAMLTREYRKPFVVPDKV